MAHDRDCVHERGRGLVVRGGWETPAPGRAVPDCTLRSSRLCGETVFASRSSHQHRFAQSSESVARTRAHSLAANEQGGDVERAHEQDDARAGEPVAFEAEDDAAQHAQH
jgi:hypothetical protein